MSLRFFVDYCIPNLVIQILRNAGHEVLRLQNYNKVIHKLNWRDHSDNI